MDTSYALRTFIGSGTEAQKAAAGIPDLVVLGDVSCCLSGDYKLFLRRHESRGGGIDLDELLLVYSRRLHRCRLILPKAFRL